MDLSVKNFTNNSYENLFMDLFMENNEGDLSELSKLNIVKDKEDKDEIDIKGEMKNNNLMKKE